MNLDNKKQKRLRSMNCRQKIQINYRLFRMRILIIVGIVLMITLVNCRKETDIRGRLHAKTSNFPSYKGLVMCGYQGWFRALGDDANNGWDHYGRNGEFNTTHCTIDFWPDVTEYEKTYVTNFKYKNGQPAYVFSSLDKSTTFLHFRWMQEYNIDGAFMQRFFKRTRTEQSRKESSVILKKCYPGCATI